MVNHSLIPTLSNNRGSLRPSSSTNSYLVKFKLPSQAHQVMSWNAGCSFQNEQRDLHSQTFGNDDISNTLCRPKVVCIRSMVKEPANDLMVLLHLSHKVTPNAEVCDLEKVDRQIAARNNCFTIIFFRALVEVNDVACGSS